MGRFTRLVFKVQGGRPFAATMMVPKKFYNGYSTRISCFLRTEEFEWAATQTENAAAIVATLQVDVSGDTVYSKVVT
jgi:hypothetical protein